MTATDTTINFLWSFPGGINGLIGVILVAALIIFLSCRYSIRKLSPVKTSILIILRLITFAGLLFCLCNPRQEEIKTYKKENPRKLAVVFDTSSSMRQPGILGKSRLHDTVNYWQRAAQSISGMEYRYYRFDETWNAIDAPDALLQLPVKENGKTINTRFYDFLQASTPFMEKSGVNGVICFTDGVDTSDKNVGEAKRALAATKLKYVFVPALTELAMQRFIEIRKIESPSKVLLNSQTPVMIMVSYSNLPVSENLEITVSDQNGKNIFSSRENRRGMAGNAVFRFEIPAEKTGIERYSAKLKINGKEIAKSEWSIETVKREKRNVLLYQGTYDWATRFLKYSLGASGRTSLEVRISSAKSPGEKTCFPSREELKNYDVVIILNVVKSQVSAKMESLLREYLNDGGGVIFITGNPQAAGEFSNSELENLLPVEFDKIQQKTKRQDEKTNKFFEQAKRYRNVNNTLERMIQRDKEFSFVPDPLKKFVLTTAGSESMIFKDGAGNAVIPQFSDFAYVKDVKPGATALATYHDSSHGDCIIMATQRFGRGRSVMIATDPLWRWKLAIPSTSHDFDVFWENLIGWTSSADKVSIGSWLIFNRHVPAGKPMQIRIKLAFPDDAQTFYAEKDGQSIPLKLTRGKEPGVMEGTFVPPQSGLYQLRAPGIASAWFTAAESHGDRELDAPAPDIYLLRQFAEGGSVRTLQAREKLDLNTLFSTEGMILTERKERPLWNEAWILMIILGCFILELILRRTFKLV